MIHAISLPNRWLGYGFVHFSSMDAVYAVLDAKELPRFEDSVNHKVYVQLLLCGGVVLL